MIFDPMYLLFILPALGFSMWASWATRSAFQKYSQVGTRRGMTGAQAAQHMLDYAGITDVSIVPTRGYLTDHYNPVTRQLALSEPTYASNSVSAVGVACHEAGHAIQHANNYAPLWMRSAIVPLAGFGSGLGYFVMLGGLMMGLANVVLLGAVLFSAVLLFQLVTLPVEFDASNRAKKLIVETGIIGQDEAHGVHKVLNAAAMTYVAAAVSTLMTLLYFLFRAGLLGNRN